MNHLDPYSATFGEEYDLSHLSPEQLTDCDTKLRRQALCLHKLEGSSKTHMIAKVCYCSKIHANEGWTVVAGRDVNDPCGFFAYKRDCPADKTHFADDLAQHTYPTKAEAIAQGKLGNFAYKKGKVV